MLAREGHVSRQFIDSRRTWRLRGRAQDYEIVRGFGLAEKPAGCVAASQLLAELDRWLGSVFSQRVLHELYESVTGLPPPPVWDRREGVGPIKRRLAEAFRQGELLALPTGPARTKKWPEAAPKGPGPRVAVPLLAQVEQALTRPPKEALEEEPEEETSTAWVEFELVDAEGEPLAGVRYRLTLADGSTREGEVGASGVVRVEGIEPGECTVVFPELDA